VNNKSMKHSDVENQDYEKVVKINRVNKVVKGGKRLAFRAFLIYGDKQGSVGLGLGKSKEVPAAIKKAVDRAKKSVEKINLFTHTIPHEVFGKSGASRVFIKPAKPGTGVIAGGAVKVVLEALGVKNAVGKSLGSRNPINVALASLDALRKCKIKENEETDRNVLISFGSKEDK
jgi:small subunit ribosomal protein S5